MTNFHKFIVKWISLQKLGFLNFPMNDERWVDFFFFFLSFFGCEIDRTQLNYA